MKFFQFFQLNEINNKHHYYYNIFHNNTNIIFIIKTFSTQFEKMFVKHDFQTLSNSKIVDYSQYTSRVAERGVSWCYKIY